MTENSDQNSISSTSTVTSSIPLKFKIIDTCLQDIDLSDPDESAQLITRLKKMGVLNPDSDEPELVEDPVTGSISRVSVRPHGISDPTHPEYEKLLDPSQRRFTTFPIKEPMIWAMYKLQQASFWKAEEIDFSRDRRDYETLSNGEKHFVKMVLAFFAASDGIVNFNLEERFIREIQVMEASICYDYQKMMENIHSEVYSMMLDNIISDPTEKDNLFNSIETIPEIKMMANWAFKWIDSDRPFAYRVIAFAFVEGVFFSGAFAAIFWLKKHKSKGRLFLEGLIKSNEFISRDEGMHTDFACLLYSMLSHRLTQAQVEQIAKEAVDIAINFTNESLRVDLIGMNKKKMGTYIKYVADRLMVSLNHQKIYKVKNPFKFITSISLFGKTNFFESRPTEYQDASILNKKRNRVFKRVKYF